MGRKWKSGKKGDSRLKKRSLKKQWLEKKRESSGKRQHKIVKKVKNSEQRQNQPRKKKVV